MKRLVLLSTVLLLLYSCTESGTRYKNPYLPNYGFSMNINLDLPLYSGLNSPINPIVVTEPGTGLTLILMKVSNTDFRAWDASCPNQYPSSCSRMHINGVNAVCSCDDYEYSIFTGTGTQGEYPMKPYRVQILEPKLIRVYN